MINSGFEINQEEFCSAPSGLIEMLEIKKNPEEKCFIVHQYCCNSKGRFGYFIECNDIQVAERILRMVFMCAYNDGKWYSLAEENQKVTKCVKYLDPFKPWFYSPTIDIKTDTFIPDK